MLLVKNGKDVVYEFSIYIYIMWYISLHIAIMRMVKYNNKTTQKVTDSMAYENVDDVQRQQGCCLCMLSCAPCCPCFKDMADVVLMGHDDSHKDGWRLKRLHKSTDVFNKLTRIVQATNKSSKPK